MKSISLQGEVPMVQVHTPAQKVLEEKAKALLLNKLVTRVNLVGDQLQIRMEDGGVFTVMASGGLREVS